MCDWSYFVVSYIQLIIATLLNISSSPSPLGVEALPQTYQSKSNEVLTRRNLPNAIHHLSFHMTSENWANYPCQNLYKRWENDLLFLSEILCFLALVGFQIPCWVFRLKLVLSQKVVHDGERAVVKLQGGWFMRPELVKPGRASPAKEGFSFVFFPTQPHYLYWLPTSWRRRSPL